MGALKKNKPSDQFLILSQIAMKRLSILFLGVFYFIQLIGANAQSELDESSLNAFIQDTTGVYTIDTGLSLYNLFGDDEGLLLALGNMFYSNNDQGNARWFYERAAFFNPSSAVAANNIDVIRQELLEIKEEPFLLNEFKKNLYFLLPVNAWAILALFFATLGACLFYGKRKGIFTKRWLLLGNLIVLVLCLLIAFGKAAYLSDSDRYVVLIAQSELRESPEVQSSVVASLRSGNLVFKKDQIGGWLKVEMTNGTAGWLESSRLKAIR
jgi:hypothetical protein